LLPKGIRREGMTGLELADGIEFDELLGDLLDPGFGPGLEFVPLLAAQLVEHGHIAVPGGVFLDLIHLFEGDVELVAIGVLDLDAFTAAAISIDLFEPLKNTHPVLDMDDIVPFLQLEQVGEGDRPPRRLVLFAQANAAVQLTVGIKKKLLRGPLKTLGKIEGFNGDLLRALAS